MEVWRHAVGLGTWRCLLQEIWSWGGVLWAWGRGGVDAWRSGTYEACCGPGDVEEA